MGSEFDASEFVDDDFQAGRKAPAPVPAAQPAAPAAADPQRAPTREEVESKVGEMQHKLSELKRAQQELERERASLEETRRRQVEFTTGREEMVQHLTRGIGLLGEAEFAARREAEQMAKTLTALREAVAKIEAVQEETWTREALSVELAKANTTIENARMEWNSARLKFPVLNGAPAEAPDQAPAAEGSLQALVREKSYAEMCKLGLALTWPIALAALAIFVALLLGK